MAVFMRLVSLILIVIALMLLGADAVTSLGKGGEITVRSLDTVWGPAQPGRPRRLQAVGAEQRHLPGASLPTRSWRCRPGR